MTSADNFISIQGLSKHFGALCAVDAISFDIAAGEFFSLLGPSGCGKTTLLRMLAGLEHSTKGEIYIDGQPMAAVAANRRPTNMVFQSYAIFPHLDVRQNIAYGLHNRQMTTAQIADAVDGALELIKMSDYGHRRSHQLSGGQRQRVALARALVCQPKVLLLDEPLGALDKKLREEMQLELRQLQRAVGITFVFVTHDQEEALTMSDRIAVMGKGRVLQIDTPVRLYERPTCREVAGFIGTMNFFEGRLLSCDHGESVVDAGRLGRLHVRTRDALPATPDVTIALRPEKIVLSDQPFAPDMKNALKGRMIARSYLGDRDHYYVEVQGQDAPVAVAAQNISRNVDPSDLNGRDMWLRWSPDAAVLLPSTGALSQSGRHIAGLN